MPLLMSFLSNYLWRLVVGRGGFSTPVFAVTILPSVIVGRDPRASNSSSVLGGHRRPSPYQRLVVRHLQASLGVRDSCGRLNRSRSSFGSSHILRDCGQPRAERSGKTAQARPFAEYRGTRCASCPPRRTTSDHSDRLSYSSTDWDRMLTPRSSWCKGIKRVASELVPISGHRRVADRAATSARLRRAFRSTSPVRKSCILGAPYWQLSGRRLFGPTTERGFPSECKGNRSGSTFFSRSSLLT